MTTGCQQPFTLKKSQKPFSEASAKDLQISAPSLKGSDGLCTDPCLEGSDCVHQQPLRLILRSVERQILINPILKRKNADYKNYVCRISKYVPFKIHRIENWVNTKRKEFSLGIRFFLLRVVYFKGLSCPWKNTGGYNNCFMLKNDGKKAVYQYTL